VVQQIFDLDTVTFGFARRFATYKRPNRLLRILTNPTGPGQLVIAGKAQSQRKANDDRNRREGIRDAALRTTGALRHEASRAN